MCQVSISVEVRYQLAAAWSALWTGTPPEDGAEDAVRADGPDALQREIQALIEDADPVPFVPDGLEQEWQQQPPMWVPRAE